jgi:hypothetical protein
MESGESAETVVLQAAAMMHTAVAAGPAEHPALLERTAVRTEALEAKVRQVPVLAPVEPALTGRPARSAAAVVVVMMAHSQAATAALASNGIRRMEAAVAAVVVTRRPVRLVAMAACTAAAAAAGTSADPAATG